MPTLYGPWQGSGYQARVKCVYTRTYNSDHTYATFDCSFQIEFGGSVSDSTNDWEVTGPGVADSSGSNVSISIPSGGGTKTLYNAPNFNSTVDRDIEMHVTGINAVGGGDIHATFTLPVGDLAPEVGSGYTATSITATGATISSITGDGNGGTLNNVQVQHNSSASTTGASLVTRGSFGSTVPLTGLPVYATRYYRVRVSNNTYGYGPWGAWKSFTTLAGVPGVVNPAWSFINVTSDSAEATNGVPASDGGSAVTGYRLWYATVDDITHYIGYVDSVAPAFPILTGLSPGTRYYGWMQAINANGEGDMTTSAGSSKAFTTLLGAYVKASGTYKSAVPFVKVGGVYKAAVRYVKVGGIYKQ